MPRSAGPYLDDHGRFKGGWTTPHYDRPDEGIHAIQMELAQSTYLQAETVLWTNNYKQNPDAFAYTQAKF